MSFHIVAFYRFVAFDDFVQWREPLLNFCIEHGIKGTVLLAQEGINGTIAGGEAATTALIGYLEQIPGFAPLQYKLSVAEQTPFLRMKVKLKNEIVTLGVPGISPTRQVGEYVKPDQWNQLIQDPTVTVIDTRNSYETQIGSFAGAIDPGTRNFREFPDYVTSQLDPSVHKKVAMFCTGGIRCEKATALLLEQGFEDVYHLEGGILKYLEEIPVEQSLWQGDCFVFDERVTVNHRLEPGEYIMCHGCRRPLSPAELKDPAFEPGVACLHCIDEKSPEQRQRYLERQRQMRLAQERQYTHLGQGSESRRVK